MSLNVLKDCKKYVVQKIYNPGNYLIADSENEKHYEKEMRWFRRSLANCMDKHADAKKICIGKMVAVKIEKSFQIGRVDDIFKRNGETKYLILLIDSGKTIETFEKCICLIKNKELNNDTKNTFEISLHGIQPAALDINDKNPISSGIFHLRKCNNWSRGAFEFVKRLFVNNPKIFVKIITHNENISGEIYFIEDFDWKPVSLSQKLCDEGFAVFCDTTVKSSNNYSQRDYCDRRIEEKIPGNAFCSNFELYKTLSKLNTPNKSAIKGRHFQIKIDEAASPQEFSCQMENDSSSSSTGHTVLECNNSRFSSTASFESNMNKCSFFGSSKNLSNSVNTLNKIVESEQTENTKLNVCRIMLRNLKLFNQQKHFRERCSQN